MGYVIIWVGGKLKLCIRCFWFYLLSYVNFHIFSNLVNFGFARFFGGIYFVILHYILILCDLLLVNC